MCIGTRRHLVMRIGLFMLQERSICCGTLIPQDAKKHAQQYTLRPINSHLYVVHVKHSMALYNVQGVSARHRAGQKAREGDAGLTCGGA